MGALNKDTFVCLDCETTGLDFVNDQVIEVAVVRFNFDQFIDTFETLIDPMMPIPEASMAIHHINDSMVHGKPKIAEVLSTGFRLCRFGVLLSDMGYRPTSLSSTMQLRNTTSAISFPGIHLLTPCA